jgi:hypothetical protein
MWTTSNLPDGAEQKLAPKSQEVCREPPALGERKIGNPGPFLTGPRSRSTTPYSADVKVFPALVAHHKGFRQFRGLELDLLR